MVSATIVPHHKRCRCFMCMPLIGLLEGARWTIPLGVVLGLLPWAIAIGLYHY